MIENIKKFTQLTEEKKALKQKLRDIQVELDALENQIEEHFVESGVSSMKVGGRTVYLRKQLFVSPNAMEGESPEDAKRRACRALQTSGLGWLVSEGYNSNTLRAVIREMQEDGHEFPLTLTDALKITERYRVGVRH